MAAKPVSTTKLFLFPSLLAMVLLSLTTTIASTTTATTKPQPRRFMTKLIHRDSIFSPYFNPNATLEDRARQIKERSIARLGYLARTSSFTSTDDVRARIIAADVGTIFLVKLSIGEPPVEQILAMDTGSSLVWVQCNPCKNCFKQFSPLYDRFASSTYQNLTCNSPQCPKNSCDSFNHCGFTFGYVDPRSSASGIMGIDTFSGFFTSDEGITSVPYIIFGCAYDNKGRDGQLSGVLGLGEDSIFMTKLGPRFSYCIGNINDPKYSHNMLVLGDGAIIQGDSTPLQKYNSLYYLILESISVGEKGLNIDPKVFQIDPKGHGGVVVDSGSTYTYLVDGAFQPLSSEVRSLLHGKLSRAYDYNEPSNLCYWGDVNRDLTGFPVVTFHFVGGAQIAVDIGGMFHQVGRNKFCMAVRQSIPDLKGLNVVGVMVQQNYNVAYDLEEGKVTIQSIDCELLES